MPKVLVIDDSAYTRMKVRDFLKKDGHETLEASDGNKGLEIALKQSPDCVILDLIMPDLDGLKILKALKDRGSVTPVIVLTADIQESVRKHCLELKAAAFINKPPKEEDIRGTVKKVLSSGRDPR